MDIRVEKFIEELEKDKIIINDKIVDVATYTKRATEFNKKNNGILVKWCPDCESTHLAFVRKHTDYKVYQCRDCYSVFYRMNDE